MCFVFSNIILKFKFIFAVENTYQGNIFHRKCNFANCKMLRLQYYVNSVFLLLEVDGVAESWGGGRDQDNLSHSDTATNVWTLDTNRIENIQNVKGERKSQKRFIIWAVRPLSSAMLNNMQSAKTAKTATPVTAKCKTNTERLSTLPGGSGTDLHDTNIFSCRAKTQAGSE